MALEFKRLNDAFSRGEVKVITSLADHPVEVTHDGPLRCDVSMDRMDVHDFRLLSCKKPYLINLLHVESIVGEWNKEKTEYGVRVYYASGNNFWFGGAVARDFLSRVYSESAEKFDKVARGA